MKKLPDVDIAKEFTPGQLKEVDEIIKRFKGKPGGLIPVLEEVQGVLGFLPVAIQEVIAEGLGVPRAQVFGVVTFYSFFTMVPRGKHTCRVCLGTACYVRGGRAIAETLRRTLGINEGETTADRMFSLESVRCLGACGLGPVLVVDEEVHGRMKPAKVAETLSHYK
jgi:NADH-quinone oxidoreductase subunit E/NADP-reducing hydrogenase subunit HndA